MPTFDRREFLWTLGVGGAAATLGRPGWAQSGTPVSGGTLNIAFLDSAKTMDPTFSNDNSEKRLYHLIYNTLLSINKDFSIKPELATAWRFENDGLRLVLDLREGVTFHDGTPFDAEAVKFNIDHRLSEEVGSIMRNQLLRVLEGAEVVGPMSVALILKTQSPGLLGELGDRLGYMMSPTAVKELGEDFGSNPVGTGAFRLGEWIRGSSITLERYEDYWEKDTVFLDRIVFQSVPNVTIGTQRLLAGEVDFVDNLAPDAISVLEGRDGIVIEKAPIGLWYSLQYQFDRPPFNNPNLRKAIAHALDRDRINQIMLDGQGVVSNGPTPPGFWWSTPETIIYEYDPEKAKQYLADAGIAPGTEIVLATPGRPDFRRLNQIVAEQLEAIGLNVTLEAVDPSVWYSRVVSKAINFVPMTWSQRGDPDTIASQILDSAGWSNTTGYANPAYDELLARGRVAATQEERIAIYTEARDMMMEDLPYVPLFFNVDFAAYKEELKGVQLMPDSIPRWRYAWKEE